MRHSPSWLDHKSTKVSRNIARSTTCTIVWVQNVLITNGTRIAAIATSKQGFWCIASPPILVSHPSPSIATQVHSYGLYHAYRATIDATVDAPADAIADLNVDDTVATWVVVASRRCVQHQGSSHDIYWAIGDGGPQTDPLGTGQNTSNILAAIIRVSVPSGTSTSDVGYTIPSGNYPGGE